MTGASQKALLYQADSGAIIWGFEVSADLAHWAAVVRAPGDSAGRFRVVSDSGAWGPYDFACGLAWGALGLAFSAESLSRQFVVYAVNRSPAYDYAGVPVFSPDGQELAYMAMTWSDSGREWFIVQDGVDGGKRYDWAEPPVFYGDGHLACLAGDAGSWFLLKDGEVASEPVRCWGASWLTFSHDGNRVAYVLYLEYRRYCVVLDGERGPEYERVSELTFSPDGKRFACVAEKAGRRCIVLDGKEGSWEDDLCCPTFSPDGRALACSVRKDSSWFMVYHEERFGPYDWCGAPVISQDGKHIAFIVEEKGPDSHGYCPLDPDEPVQRNDRYCIAVDGEAGEWFEAVGAACFSTDGKKIFYPAVQAGELYLVETGVH